MNNRPKPQTITEAEVKVPTLSEILANEKNINLSALEQTILSRNDIVNTLIINTGAVVITKNSVIVIENGQQKDGSVLIPKALTPYFGEASIVSPRAQT